MLSAVYRALALSIILIAMIVASQAPAQESSPKLETKSLMKEETSKFRAIYNYSHRQFEGTLASNYVYQPENLTVSTHTMGLNYEITKAYFISATARHLRNDIRLSTSVAMPGMPTSFDASTEGMSDTLIGIGRQWELGTNGHFVFTMNLSLPTGNYEEKTETGRLVSYQGQLGSGTYDLVPTIYYRQKIGKWDLNARAQGIVHTGRNDLDYRLGDEISTTLAGAYWFSKYIAITGSLYYRNWREVVGSENVTAFNSQVSAANRANAMRAAGANTGRPPHGTTSAATQGRPPTGNPNASSHGGRPPSSYPSASSTGRPPGAPTTVAPFANPFADKETGDIFAAAGARWSAQLGLRTGIYLGPVFRAIVEAGLPIYNDQNGPLEGLNSTWYAMTAIQSSF